MLSAQSRAIRASQTIEEYEKLYSLFPPSTSSSSSSSTSPQSTSQPSTPPPSETITSKIINGYYSESVRVPTSAHVAQIVGKQGSKIKSLRSKSNTFIQTPVPGEEPIFVITGREEDVIAIKAEILNAADHFSAIQKERDEKLTNSRKMPGSHRMSFEVPIYLVGLIVGKNGNNIRTVQRETDTYIATPKKDEDPVFIISGLRTKVDEAIAMIISHTHEKTNLEFVRRDKDEESAQLVQISKSRCTCRPNGNNRTEPCDACISFSLISFKRIMEKRLK